MFAETNPQINNNFNKPKQYYVKICTCQLTHKDSLTQICIGLKFFKMSLGTIEPCPSTTSQLINHTLTTPIIKNRLRIKTHHCSVAVAGEDYKECMRLNKEKRNFRVAKRFRNEKNSGPLHTGWALNIIMTPATLFKVYKASSD